MPRIFLVEDDREIAKNLTLLLRSEGFTVTHAPTREEAFAAADGNKFDLALIDIALPDGYKDQGDPGYSSDLSDCLGR